MANDLTELEDRWILPLRDSRVLAVEWDNGARLVLDPPGEIIAGLGTLLTQGSVAAPGAVLRTLGELGPDGVRLACAGGRILSAVAFKSGALRIVLDSGWHLNVRSGGEPVTAEVISGGSVLWRRPSSHGILQD